MNDINITAIYTPVITIQTQMGGKFLQTPADSKTLLPRTPLY